MSRYPASKPVGELFWPKVDKTETGCWIWTANKTPEGYGLFTWSGRRFSAHRACYEEFRGPIPPGLHLDHLCRTRACVNPDHLEPVTPAENNRRAAAIKAAALVCVAGHAWSENAYRPPGRQTRQCRACVRAAGQRYRDRERAAL